MIFLKNDILGLEMKNLKFLGIRPIHANICGIPIESVFEKISDRVYLIDKYRLGYINNVWRGCKNWLKDPILRFPARNSMRVKISVCLYFSCGRRRHFSWLVVFKNQLPKIIFSCQPKSGFYDLSKSDSKYNDLSEPYTEA